MLYAKCIQASVQQGTNSLFFFNFQIIVPLKTASVLQQSHLPEYLPEEESLHEESEKAVLQTGTKTDAKSSWINSATHFLTKAFYWRLISQQKLFKTFLIV